MNNIPVDQTKLQRVISTTLRSGVTVAAAIGVCGGLLHLTTEGVQQINFHAFEGAGSPYAFILGILQALAGSNHAERGLAVVQVGILALLH